METISPATPIILSDADRITALEAALLANNTMLEAIMKQNADLVNAISSAETVHHIGIHVFKLRKSLEEQDNAMYNIDQYFETELKKIWEFIAVSNDNTARNTLAIVNKVNDMALATDNMTSRVAAIGDLVSESTIGFDNDNTKLEAKFKEIEFNLHDKVNHLLDEKDIARIEKLEKKTDDQWYQFNDSIERNNCNYHNYYADKRATEQRITKLESSLEEINESNGDEFFAISENFEHIEAQLEDHEDTQMKHLATMNQLNDKIEQTTNNDLALGTCISIPSELNAVMVRGEIYVHRGVIPGLRVTGNDLRFACKEDNNIIFLRCPRWSIDEKEYIFEPLFKDFVRHRSCVIVLQ